MADVIGRGVIELSTDGQKLRGGVDEAKKSLNELGITAQNATKSASASIDRYVRSLGVAAVTSGQTARQQELLKLGLRGATDAQLKAADAALKLTEAHEKGVAIGERVRASFIAIGLAAGTGLIAAAAAFNQLVNGAGKFQDMAEKIGDSAENLASLAVAAKVGGIEMDAITAASVKLTKGLTGVDDETKAAGAAVTALGLDLANFKTLAPAAQFEAVAKALAGFEDGTQKTAVAVALFGKAGAEMLPFLKELGQGVGRQNILTSEQIRLADEYSDKQARNRALITANAQAIATEMLPAYNALTVAINDAIKGIAGINESQKGLGNSTGIQDFANGAVKAVAFAVDSIDGLIRVLQLAYIQIKLTASAAESIAAIARAANPVTGNIDFLTGKGSPVNNIKAARAQLIDDAKNAASEADKILQRPTLGRLLDNRLAELQRDRSIYDPGDKQTTRRTLNFSGAADKSKSGADTAAQEAKARLAADLADIISTSRVIENTFQNQEKVMEARRAAGLVEDREYYEEKRNFIELTSIAQESAIEAQIARLQKEVFTGKDAAKNEIDNAKEIAKAREKLNEIRQNGATGLQVLSIQEEAAAVKLKQSYLDAEAAAQSYLDTLIRANNLQLSGQGVGNKERERQSGRAQIEDRYSTQLQQLARDRREAELRGPLGTDAQKKYDDELDRIKRFSTLALQEYDRYYQARLNGEADWSVGAIEALRNYGDEARNVAKLTEDVFTGAFKKLEDSLTEFLTKGKTDWRSFADYAITELNRIAVKKALGELADQFSSGTGFIGKIASSVGLGSAAYEGVAGEAIAEALVGSFAAGTDYVPRTGLALVHQGERITPAAENKNWDTQQAPRPIAITISQSFAPGTDGRTVNQAAAETGRQVQRAVARFS